MNWKRPLFLFSAMGALLLVGVLVSLFWGLPAEGSRFPWDASLIAWWKGQDFAHSYPASTGILLQLRLPRIVLAVLAGAHLALAGLIMQSLFGNPLADPYITGVSSGAALGAVIAFCLKWDSSLWGLNSVSFLAFSGAMGVACLVYAMARKGSALSLSHLLLTGICISALAQAVTTFLLFSAENQQLRSALHWLFGSLAYRDWGYVRGLLAYTVIGVISAFAFHWHLDLLAMGEEGAHHLGIRLGHTKTLLLMIASLLAASTVAACGIIGFVGLIIPHAMRALFGASHRILIPACVVGGALLLVLSDLVARVALSGQEIPIGMVTSVIGSLFFLILLLRSPGGVR
ncbi:MAG: hypothetical protein RLZZ399_622 [Verrucomicrobiota bacterium]|jgi:iron complex transport system permease protein